MLATILSQRGCATCNLTTPFSSTSTVKLFFFALKTKKKVCFFQGTSCCEVTSLPDVMPYDWVESRLKKYIYSFFNACLNPLLLFHVPPGKKNVCFAVGHLNIGLMLCHQRNRKADFVSCFQSKYQPILFQSAVVLIWRTLKQAGSSCKNCFLMTKKNIIAAVDDIIYPTQRPFLWRISLGGI